jgi:hypothetical protein
MAALSGNGDGSTALYGSGEGGLGAPSPRSSTPTVALLRFLKIESMNLRTEGPRIGSILGKSPSVSSIASPRP